MGSFCTERWDHPSYVGTATFLTESKHCEALNGMCGQVTIPVSKIAALYTGTVHQVPDSEGHYSYKIELESGKIIQIYSPMKPNQLSDFLFDYRKWDAKDEKKKFNRLPEQLRKRFRVSPTNC